MESSKPEYIKFFEKLDIDQRNLCSKKLCSNARPTNFYDNTSRDLLFFDALSRIISLDVRENTEVIAFTMHNKKLHIYNNFNDHETKLINNLKDLYRSDLETQQKYYFDILRQSKIYKNKMQNIKVKFYVLELAYKNLDDQIKKILINWYDKMKANFNLFVDEIKETESGSASDISDESKIKTYFKTLNYTYKCRLNLFLALKKYNLVNQCERSFFEYSSKELRLEDCEFLDQSIQTRSFISFYNHVVEYYAFTKQITSISEDLKIFYTHKEFFKVDSDDDFVYVRNSRFN